MPSLWQQSASLLRAPLNEITFAVRSRLRWSRGAPRPAREGAGDLFDWLEGRDREHAIRCARQLVAEFDLVRLRENVTRLVFAENLAMLDRLSALAEGVELTNTAGVVSAIDVGCGSFQYATALQRWLQHHGRSKPRRVKLRGIEIDGFGIYRDGHSRADHARAHAALAGSDVAFEVADFTRIEVEPQDVVTMSFPFLSAFSLLQWGSPLSHLRPRRFVERAVGALRPGGILVVVNQTEVEFDRLRHLLVQYPLTLERQVSFGTSLVPYGERTQGRIGSLWRRNALPEAAPNV